MDVGPIVGIVIVVIAVLGVVGCISCAVCNSRQRSPAVSYNGRDSVLMIFLN